MTRAPLSRYIEAILETGSISQASKKLYLAQPSLSQFIRRVESTHAIELFDRSSQPWKLTDDGAFFLDVEKRIEALCREREQYFSDKHELMKGQLRIGSTQYRTATVLNRVLPIFRTKYPNIRIQIAEGTSSEIVEFAEKGLVDCSLAVQSLVTKNLDCKPVEGEHVLLCVPENHPEVRVKKTAKKTRFPVVSFKEFANDDFIVLKPGQMFHIFFHRLCAQYRVNPNVAMESHSITTVPTMVAAGLGVALVPSPLANLGYKGVRFYETGDDLPVNWLTVAWSSNRYLSKATAAFIHLTSEILGCKAL